MILNCEIVNLDLGWHMSPNSLKLFKRVWWSVAFLLPIPVNKWYSNSLMGLIRYYGEFLFREIPKNGTAGEVFHRISNSVKTNFPEIPTKFVICNNYSGKFRIPPDLFYAIMYTGQPCLHLDHWSMDYLTLLDWIGRRLWSIEVR